MANVDILHAVKDSSGNVIEGNAQTATFTTEDLDPKNFDYIGFILDMPAGSGTSPTCDIKFEISVDGGTTYLELFPQVAATFANADLDWTQLTGADEYCEFWPNFLPFNSNCKIRATFTIGGTNPSWTPTSFKFCGIYRNF